MDKDTLSKVSAIALNNIFGYEPKFSHNIIDSLGSAEAVFDLTEDEKLQLFGPYSRFSPLVCRKTLDDAAALYENLSSQGYGVCSIFDSSYPALLKDCSDAPVVLYVRSGSDMADIFRDRPAVAVVGTRDISPYGSEWCERIVRALADAQEKPLIVSGMALGVDITAHRTALDCGLSTIGVLPVGIDDIYPRRHARDASIIAGAPDSALITDYPPGTGPVAFNFLRRNRIIAGLASATILVESKSHGGGTMTSRLAFGYGRSVYALPGRVDDVRSAGCNRLIAEKVAEPVTDLSELVSQLGLGIWKRRKTVDFVDEVRCRYEGVLSEERRGEMCTLASMIRERRGIDYDSLCEGTGMSYSLVSTLAGMLEADGLIVVDLMQRCRVNVK